MKAAYRPDIDGLRAIAVLAVLLFHLDVTVISGGFVGVDVFFVISGYLITKLIADEVATTGGFSFGRFYIRRIRRLFPAMAVTLVFTLIGSAVYLPPSLFSEASASAIAALLSASNFYFWSNVGYFDTASSMKPLLHTWSLSVEEQFYLVWPLTLVTILRKAQRPSLTTPLTLLVLSAISLGLSAWFIGTKDGQSTVFYLPQFRVFELGIGGLTVWLSRGRPPKYVEELMVVMGLALIAYCVFTYTDKTIFPSFNALPPCVGAALLILGGRANFSGVLLRNALSVWIGRISYSLYLIHWPLIVLVRYSYADPLETQEQIGIFAASIILAAIMYYFVEQRFRHEPMPGQGLSRPAFAARFALIACLIAIPATSALVTGWSWRFSPKMAQQFSITREQINAYVGDRQVAWNKDFANNGKKKVLVVGDSMSGDLVNLIAESGMAEQLDVRTFIVTYLCQPVLLNDQKVYETATPLGAPKCRADADALQASDRLKAADIVILAGLWPDWAIDHISETADHIRSVSHARIAIIGPKSQAINGFEYLSRNARRSDIYSIVTPYRSWTVQANAKLEEAAKTAGVEFYNPLSLFCHADGCPLTTPSGDLIFYDQSHLTEAGAKFIATKFKDMWSVKLLKTQASS